MNKNSCLIGILFCFYVASVDAGSMGSVTTPFEKPWVATLSAGPVWENGGQTQTFYLTPSILKSYIANQFTQTLFDGELFLGLQKTFSQSIKGQFGLAVAATSNAGLSGVIWDDADQDFDNFTYTYNIQHTHVALKAKLLADKGYWLIPWVSGSIGVGFNNASSYHSTPIIFEAIPTPNFSSNIQTSFTYTVGLGVQKWINSNWQVGLGYEFADWGQSALGKSQEQTINTGLTLNHLYTNGLLFNLTYLS